MTVDTELLGRLSLTFFLENGPLTEMEISDDSGQRIGALIPEKVLKEMEIAVLICRNLFPKLTTSDELAEKLGSIVDNREKAREMLEKAFGTSED